MKNLDVRMQISDSGLKHYEIARELGISCEWLSRLLRFSLTAENKQRVLDAVSRLQERRSENKCTQ